MDRYAVVGNPVAHSKSPKIHRLFAQHCGQQLSYDKILIEPGEFDREVRAFFAAGGRGLNVTVPFKEEAKRFSDELSERARVAAAVNTLILTDAGTILGDNTDGAGLLWDLRDNLRWPLQGARILIFGAGGATRGILQPLLRAGLTEIVVINRTHQKAEKLAEEFSSMGRIRALPDSELCDAGRFDLLINASSAGLKGISPEFGRNNIDATTCCYDLVYANGLTPFLQKSKQLGVANLADGLGMLVGQAAESFFLWRQVRPDARAVLDIMRKELQSADK